MRKNALSWSYLHKGPFRESLCEINMHLHAVIKSEDSLGVIFNSACNFLIDFYFYSNLEFYLLFIITQIGDLIFVTVRLYPVRVYSGMPFVLCKILDRSVQDALFGTPLCTAVF